MLGFKKQLGMYFGILVTVALINCSWYTHSQHAVVVFVIIVVARIEPNGLTTELHQ